MRIAICEYSEQDLSLLVGLLLEYRAESKRGIAFKSFANGIDLLDELQKQPYDVIFLDPHMSLVSGIEVAREIRKTDNKTLIVFLASSADYALESYTVDAYYYLLKPCKKLTLFPLLESIYALCSQQDDFFIVKTKQGMAKILFCQIVYVEVTGKTVTFHMADNCVHEACTALDKFEKYLLSRTEFCRIHRAYIVNLYYIKELSGQSLVTIFQQQLPVSRRLHTYIKQHFIKHMLDDAAFLVENTKQHVFIKTSKRRL